MEGPIIDPGIPYVGPVTSGSFKPGRSIRIQGNTPGVAYRFDINLQCGPSTIPRDDIAMQVSVHILDGYIATNSLQNGIWGDEQQGDFQPVKRAEKFEIVLMCIANIYKVFVNGQHFCDFPQRVHYECITHLTIEGDVSIMQINFENSTSVVPASTATSVLLRQHDDNFEIINKPTNLGFTQPPSYTEVTRGHYSNVPPYPTNNPMGMPQPVPYSPGIATSSPYVSPSATAAPSPPPGVTVPSNAAPYNFRTVEKSNTKKICGIIWGIIIGILFIIIIVVSKVRKNTNRVNDNSNYQSSSYNNYDNHYNSYENYWNRN